VIAVTVHFYSYFKDLTGCAETTAKLEPGSTLGELVENLAARFPKLAAMQKSMLVAVGVDYQQRSYQLIDGETVSLFPPVQGG
jgi:sulfur-carrier protein